MKIAKIRNVKTPTRGTEKSAGLDFYIPEEFNPKLIAPMESVLIPSGIKANIPKGFALIAMNKSGIALHKNLQVGACVIDEDYQGEIHIHLTNVGHQLVAISPGDKIVQFLCLPIAYIEVDVVSIDILYSQVSDRGEGNFGSTGGS